MSNHGHRTTPPAEPATEAAAHFVFVEMPADEWRDYMIREYNALADRWSAEHARAVAAERRAAETEAALRAMVEHIDLNGGCHRGCPEHDDARAALSAGGPERTTT